MRIETAAIVATASMLISGAALAVDSEYQVAPPVSASNCPAIQVGLDPSLNCYYTVTGNFTDKYDFSVTDTSSPSYSFEVIGKSTRYTVMSGKAHPTYTTSTTITNVSLVDVATGSIVEQLQDNPFWSSQPCTNSPSSGCSPHQTDDWTGSFEMPVGSYSLVILGTVGGNRPGVYRYDLQPAAPAPVSVPLGDVVAPVIASLFLMTGLLGLMHRQPRHERSA